MEFLQSKITHAARLLRYPDGSALLMVADREIFREPGWEAATPPKAPEPDLDTLQALFYPEEYMARIEDEGFYMETAAYAAAQEAKRRENRARCERRARARVRDIAMSNDFRYFVTLTLDGAKVNRYDVKEVTRKLNQWASNAVRRHGLKYVLVPELHKDGAIHFHGFFNDALPAEDSGTLSKGGRPRRPRSAAERARMLAEGWHIVYNLPAWKLGFTTAIELYGEKPAAVNYVCKYITKAVREAGERGKIGGRWYYSGGALEGPAVEYPAVNYADVATNANSFEIPGLGARVAVLHLDQWRGGDDLGEQGQSPREPVSPDRADGDGVSVEAGAVSVLRSGSGTQRGEAQNATKEERLTVSGLSYAAADGPPGAGRSPPPGGCMGGGKFDKRRLIYDNAISSE